MKQYDYLIVGSGLFGATFAFFARNAGKRCLVIDKRPHLGGSVYCEEVEGINVHKYGPHIFHTSNTRVWHFVKSIVPFNRFVNHPLSINNNAVYSMPFNMYTFYQLWGVTTPEAAQLKVEEQCAEAVKALNGREPANLEELALSTVGRDIYKVLIKGYTEKQWGRECKDLPASILGRLPLRFSYDSNYFDDTYQGVPVGGYNKLIDGLLNGVETRVNCDFFANRAELTDLADKIVYTGTIDEFYDFRYGHLGFRTVSFEQETLDMPNYQGNAVIVYPEREVPYTRVIEHKHFEMFGQSVYDCQKTVISREYSTEWQPGKEPYYPITDAENNALYRKYKALARQEQNVLFGGRLADYKYYDMDDVIKKAWALVVMEIDE